MRECFHCHRCEIEKAIDKTCECGEYACLACAAKCIAREYEEWFDCDNCGGTGYSHHECGEDTCCCMYPEDNVRCDICGGKGGWIETFSRPQPPKEPSDG